MELGNLNIPKIKIEPFGFDISFQTQLFRLYTDYLKNHEVGQKEAEKIRNDSRVKALEGKMISYGSGAQRFDVNKLTMWFLWCVNEYGEESAKEYLDAFLDDHVVSVMNTLWVLGIEVAEPIQLKDGFEILPIEGLPNTRDKEMFLQGRSGHATQPQPFPSSAIIYRCKVNKTQNSDVTISDNENHEFRQASSRLYDIALLLNALDGISCLPYYKTSYAFPTTPFGPFNGSGGGSPLYDVWGYSMSKLTTNDQPIIEELIQNYDKLPDSEKQRFQRILLRLSQAKRRSQIEDKILDLGITLEMLLLDDNTKDQLSLAFRLRGGWLLGKTEADRLTIYYQLKDIYEYRSRVAHSGILGSSKIQKVREVFPEYQSLAEQACRVILKTGKPDWTKIVLGFGEES